MTQQRSKQRGITLVVIAVAMLALVWPGYAVGLWGYCLVRGYKPVPPAKTGPLGGVSFGDLVIPSRWPGWPPGTLPGAAPPAKTPVPIPGGGQGGYAYKDWPGR